MGAWTLFCLRSLKQQPEWKVFNADKFRKIASLPYFIAVFVISSLSPVILAQNVPEFFEFDYQSGTYKPDLNGDGISDLLIVSYNSVGNAHSTFNFDFFISLPTNNLQKLYTVRPSFSTSGNADCASRNIKLVKLGSIEPNYQVLVIVRTGVPSPGVSVSPVEFRLLKFQTFESPGSPLFSYQQSRTATSVNSYCSVNDAFDSEWESIARILAPPIVVSDQLAEPEVAIIPAGSFRMGPEPHIQSPPASKIDNMLGHPVEFEKPFGIGKTEITFAQFDYFADATGRDFPDDNGWGRGDFPVINISWSDAKAYTLWLSQTTGKNYRLPSESEWEYVARAGTKSQHFWGDTINEIRGKANCAECLNSDDSPGRTLPVASFLPNAFGVYDMHGNVAEWVEDDVGEYDDIPTNGDAYSIPNGLVVGKIVRGGNWKSDLLAVSSSRRSSSNRPFEFRRNDRGFRVALDLD